MGLLLQSVGSSHESFPFANDNIGTIRMRQQHPNSSVSATNTPSQVSPQHFPVPMDKAAANGRLPDPSQAQRMMSIQQQQQGGPGAAANGRLPDPSQAQRMMSVQQQQQ